MKTLRHLVGLALVPCAALAGAPAAAAEGPGADCARARSTVEKLICRDAALAALDRRLQAAYRAAQARAQGALAATLRAEQRGWVKGRDECWKADGQKTWITATWTVESVRDCVDAQTRLRLAELQALWRLLPPRTTAYACNGEPANEVVVHAFDTDPPTLRLEQGDRSWTLWRVGPAEAGRHEGANIDATLLGQALTVQRLDVGTGQTVTLRCAPGTHRSMAPR